MTALWPQATLTYPSSDGEPVAETYAHLYALLITLEVLRQYLAGRRATVLGNQFLYYAQGFPKLRVAPDVMVIFEVEPGGRDNYKIWKEGRVPSVIFEMTSASTRQQDEVEKKTLYEGLGVQEYWLFDPKGEWIVEQLKGYRLRDEGYEPIVDSCSEPLGLRLQIDGGLIAFYRQDTGEKLLIPDELAVALRQEALLRQQAEQRAVAAERELEALKTRMRDRGIDPDTLLS
ncbi:Uma2 family endonuclease [Nodosilinea sp. LEGE 07298]|jgi:Uma2 family endonuclease|uniref:Uma2 family endonuclease n=1 Tax=Nodosilinea sp. LEGE 07298 TaxID=2777970 RepID=UPI00187F30F7|nr:Uma2 family endonuclease [Nodosilinea sp. LEGE 07298]MBE9112009.1 Uma2 family endonuclease [Nodosilinea sp. LEGE 07298]